jgi:HD-like signal output (HDOD) protein/CheY-like chemotaxis protein
VPDAEFDSVLIVDDEPPFSSVVALELGRFGYRVMVARSAEAALEVLAKAPPSCVLTDLRMPGAGGHALARRCRTLYPRMPVVVMSGHGDKEDVIECLREGAADYLSKPFSSADLRATVARVLENRGPPLEVAGSGARSAEALVTPATPIPSPAEPPPAQPKSFLDRLRSGEIPVPSSPKVALEARRLAMSEECSAQSLKEVVERDPHLAGRIIQVANSGQYKGFVRLTDLKAAIARVGTREVISLVETLMLKDFYTVDHALAPLVRRNWSHSLARAYGARCLASECLRRTVDPERVYLSALFADLGASFLYRFLAEQGPSTSGADVIKAVERQHAEVGAVVAEAWKLPPEVVWVCRDHHQHRALADLSPILQFTRMGAEMAEDLGHTSEHAPVPGTDAERASAGIGVAEWSAAMAQAEMQLRALAVTPALTL